MKLNRNGSSSWQILTLIATGTLLVAAIIFAFWAFAGRQKYKNDTVQLINSAVVSAIAKQKITDQASFAIAEQNPLTEYIGPQAYGTIRLWYPKNWSSYVNSTGEDSDNNPLDGYLYPGTLPSVTDNGSTNFALRIQVESQSYSAVLAAFNGQQTDNTAPPNIIAYSLPKVPSVVGVEITGEVESNISGTMIMLPLRANTLEVWTEGTAYLTEFEKDILPNLSFSP